MNAPDYNPHEEVGFARRKRDGPCRQMHGMRTNACKRAPAKQMRGNTVEERRFSAA